MEEYAIRNDSNETPYDIICFDAIELAEKYSLDSDRIISVLMRSACTAEGVKYTEDQLMKGDLRKGLAFRPHLEVALYYMQPKDALELFENSNLDELAVKNAFAATILSPGFPLYTLEQLGELAKKFINYQGKNRECLLKHGIPYTRFIPSSWMHKKLSNLYFTDIPVVVGEAFFRDRGRSILYASNINNYDTQVSTGNPPIFALDKDGKIIYKNSDTDSSHQHDKNSPVIAGITDIEVLRNKVFDIKCQILKILHNTISNHHANIPLTDCIDIIISTLTPHEIAMLIDNDLKYSKISRMQTYRIHSAASYDNRITTGGLLDILNIIDHYNAENSIGVLSKIRELLGPISKLRQSNGMLVRNYYQSVGLQCQDKLDRTYKIYTSLIEDVKLSHMKYCHTVGNVFTSCLGFYININITPSPGEDNRIINQITPILLDFTNSLNEISSVQCNIIPSEDAQTQENLTVFSHSDDYRRVTYGNEVFILSIGQAKILNILHTAYQEGKPIVDTKNRDSGLHEMSRISDYYRYNDPRKKLVKRVGKTKYMIKL